MTKKKDDKIIRLIISHEPEMINSRFLVKMSTFDNGVDESSIMVVVSDLLESGFTIKFFKSITDATHLLRLLNAASK